MANANISPTVVVTLKMGMEEAQLLQALLLVAPSWVKVGAFETLHNALSDAGVESTIEQDSAVTAAVRAEWGGDANGN